MQSAYIIQVMPTECQHLCGEESRAAITLGPGLAFQDRAGGSNCRGGERMYGWAGYTEVRRKRGQHLTDPGVVGIEMNLEPYV